MRTCDRAIGLLLLGWLAVSGVEGAGRPLREARSENGAFLLRLDPGRNRAEAPCRATLLRRDAEGRRGAAVWQGKLANEIAPEHAFVRDDGAFVVTLNEFRRGGAAHALVVYDRAGARKAEFGLRQLLVAGDWAHVRARERAIDWLSEARFRFVPDEPQFEIALGWGPRIRIDLEQGKVVRDDAQAGGPDASDGLEVPAEIAALLGAPETPDGEPLAEAGGADGPPGAADGGEPGATPSADELAEQIAQMLHMASGGADLEASGLSAERIEQIATDLAEQLLAEPDAPIDVAAAMAESPAVAEHFAGPWIAGVAVPQPDPLNPVDYVQWFNDTRQQSGYNAAAAFDAALQKATPWAGDEALRTAAMKGDPAALNDPAVQAWLAANRESLDSLSEGATADYFALHHESPDGSMIGILLPNLGQMRDLARAAVAEGKLLESRGERSVAADRYMDLLSAGALTGRGGTMIEHLVGTVIQTQGSEAFLDMLANDAGGELDYVALAENLDAAYRPTAAPEYTMQFERAFMLDTLQRIYRPNAEGKPEFSLDAAVEFQGLMDGTDQVDAAALQQQFEATSYEQVLSDVNAHYDALTEAVRQPFPEAQARLLELGREVLTPANGAPNPVLRALTPALGRYLSAATRGEANRRATRLVTQLRAFRQANGRYPASLAEIGSDATGDPFSGGDFRYRLSGDDFELYSPGPDGVDDGGTPGESPDAGDLRYWPRRTGG